jgi:hypothetical protein
MGKGMGISVSDKDQQAKWRAEDDLRTLMAADEIKEDKKRMDAVRGLAKEKLVDLARLSVMAGDKPEANDKN